MLWINKIIGYINCFCCCYYCCSCRDLYCHYYLYCYHYIYYHLCCIGVKFIMSLFISNFITEIDFGYPIPFPSRNPSDWSILLHISYIILFRIEKKELRYCGDSFRKFFRFKIIIHDFVTRTWLVSASGSSWRWCAEMANYPYMMY